MNATLKTIKEIGIVDSLRDKILSWIGECRKEATDTAMFYDTMLSALKHRTYLDNDQCEEIADAALTDLFGG